MNTLPYLHLAGHDILFVMAADAEYGHHLRQRIVPLLLGVGPVEAAINLTAALSEVRIGPTGQGLPDLVVSLGSAGSRTLQHAEVFQVSAVSYRDMDASPLGFPKGITPLLDLPAIVSLPHQIPGLPSSTLATGASVVSGDAYDQIDAGMVDMETFAVLRVCQRFNLPLIGLRGISDGQHTLTRLEDWTTYLPLVDERLAHAVDLLKDALNSQQLRLLSACEA